MKAIAVFPDTQTVELIEQAEPKLVEPGQVKLRILEIGICGTDREISHFEYGLPPQDSRYLVLGHESLAEVVEAVSQDTAFQPGDLVVPMVRRPCPHSWCTACRNGSPDYCLSGDFVEKGIKHSHGFMTEFVIDDPHYLVGVPPGLRDVAILIEPLTVVEKSVAQLAHLRGRFPWTSRGGGPRPVEDSRALVLGAGPIGLLGAMRLRAAGYPTYVYSLESPTSERALVAEAIGAAYFSAQDQTLQEAADSVGGFDLVFEATGIPRAAFQSLHTLNRNGICLLTGVPALGKPLELEAGLLMRRLVLENQMVVGIVNAGRADYEAAVRSVREFKRRWPDALKALISSRNPLDDFANLLLGRPEGIKHVMAP